MKCNIKCIAALLATLFVLTGCDENTGTLGWELIPPSDVITTHATTFEIESESVMADSVYARTETGYLGRYSDPEFGYYEASFLSEFNTVDDFKFPEVYKFDEATQTATGYMAGDTCAGIQLTVIYNTWFGDSIAACRMTAYELNETWAAERGNKGLFYRYTNMNTERYYDKNKPLGSQPYTAHDFTVVEDKNLTGSNYAQSQYVNIAMDKAQGQAMLQLNREHPEYFKNNETLREHVIPGIYLRTDYGDGTILYVSRVDLRMRFRFHYTDEKGIALKKKITDASGKAGEDSLYYSTQTVFSTTPEVIQSTRFTNSDKLKEKLKETAHTYLKTPAGIFTQLTIPYDDVYQQLGTDSLNAAKLTLTNYALTDDDTMLNPPTILLIRNKDMKAFFEGNELADNKITYTSTQNASEKNKYVFDNIARLISVTYFEKKAAKEAAGDAWTDEMEAKWIEENKVMVVPVVVDTYYDNNTGSTTTIGTRHNLEPTYAKLVGGTDRTDNKLNNPIKLTIISSKIGK